MDPIPLLALILIMLASEEPEVEYYDVKVDDEVLSKISELILKNIGSGGQLVMNTIQSQKELDEENGKEQKNDKSQNHLFQNIEQWLNRPRQVCL